MIKYRILISYLIIFSSSALCSTNVSLVEIDESTGRILHIIDGTLEQGQINLDGSVGIVYRSTRDDFIFNDNFETLTSTDRRCTICP